MHVDDLLRLETLDLTLLWGEGPQLDREISGVTVTDLEDPGRFLRPGEVVLSGLVWWSPADDGAKADRFVAALHEAGAAALLAGEETHGSVPEALVDACRRHGIAILSVPVHMSFRAITDTVYLRQWGDLSRRPAGHYALPENVRAELSGLLADGADPGTLLTRAVAHLGGPPAYVLSATGRTIASTPAAPRLSEARAVRALRPAAASPATTLSVDPDASAFGQWYLYLPEAVEAPPRMLHETAEVLAQHRQATARRATAARRLATDLLTLAETPAPGPAALRAALHACGLPDQGPYTVVTLTVATQDAPGSGAPDALTEALSHLAGARFAVGGDPERGEATAVIAPRPGTDPAVTLRPLWPTLQARAETAPLHGGISAPAATPQDLKGALVQARYAMAVAVGRTGDAGAGTEDAAARGEGGEARETRGDGLPAPETGGAGAEGRGARGEGLTARAAGAGKAANAGSAGKDGKAGKAGKTGGIIAIDELTTLDALLAGIPTDVRTAFGIHALGPLADATNPSHRMLLETLDVFLAHNGSWARTAAALHLHVNTVHYRIQRVETLTGRDLARLDHKLDLKAALLCR
ncbi:PucR family transcriptional regulator ligand-binding domain-containing protein [Streptomyces sp. NPDC049916]|uniref:PucR family transcriptional regulator n=1 Tax=Streptomyces sp. NPDC049916 TaxID=3155156 RepID=UPI00342F9137